MTADPLEELRARIASAQAATESLAQETAAAREEAGIAGTELHALAAAARAALEKGARAGAGGAR